MGRFVARAVPRVAFMLVVIGVLTALPAAFEVSDIELAIGNQRGTPPTPRPLEEIDLDLELVARVPRPTAMAYRYRDEAIYVASKKGQVYSLRDGDLDVVLDISKELSFGFEQGLLGVTFSPDGHLMVINFTNRKDASVTRAYVIDEGEVDDSSGKDLLVVPKPAENHNAGNVVFGPDDYLYLSLGDGGLSGDPKGNAQSLKSPLGKIHRIELLPDRTYAIPSTNPFAGEKGKRGEIWAYGFRNPWRFSFDRGTGDLWISDVGRDTYEEINRQPAAAEGGRNYGWHNFEGPKTYEDDRLTDRKDLEEHVPPVHWYKHREGVCSVTGGYVYRGKQIEGLDGAYLYSDYCKGGIEAIRLDGDEVAEEHEWPIDVAQISSFGEDAHGEVYVLALTEGAVYQIVEG